MKKEITIILGSKSDLEKLKDVLTLLDTIGVDYALHIISAHRNPDKLRTLCKELEKKGTKVVIACAGLAAALPGFVASYVNIPVIGVPMEGGILSGLDALSSIVQVPKGVGLVSSGMGKRGLLNACIVALEIVALASPAAKTKLSALKKRFKG